MSAKTFIKRQLLQIQQGGRAVLFRKMKRALQICLKLPLFILAFPVVLVICLIRPWLLIRWSSLNNSRIGHFVADTELYLCEQDAGINVPKQRDVDFFYMPGKPISNEQLAIMWKRVLRICPVWMLAPIMRVNRVIPGGLVQEVGDITQGPLDVKRIQR